MLKDNLYIVAVVFIAMSLVLQSFFIDKYNTLTSKVGYIAIVVLLFSAVYFLFFTSSKENFFFEVSKCNPKCSGAYYGKPATFQFSPLSVNGTKCDDKNCGYGMISACDNPECKDILKKYGGPSPEKQL
jgi:hypothetical protein